MNTTSRIGTACAVAGLGAFLSVAYCLQYGGWWWLPILVGLVCGGIAWAVVAPKHLCQQFSRALHNVTEMSSLEIPGFFVAIAFFVYVLYALFSTFDTEVVRAQSALFKTLFIATIILAGIALVILIIAADDWIDGYKKADEVPTGVVTGIVILFSPLGLVLWPPIIGATVVYGLYRFIVSGKLVKTISWFLRSPILLTKGLIFLTIGICKVIWLTFKWSHDDVRKICFIDTFLGVLGGTLVGFWYWNAFYAGIAGLILGPMLGMVNYQLVSIRWLKLQPRTA
jgi:hypothetical protein